MESKQRVIVVLLVLAILFSAASMLIAHSVLNGSDELSASPQESGSNPAQVSLIVEPRTAEAGAGS